ncbi:hypothetical protein SK128_027157 [Halocaridina rubra]|uniref:Uncharacterized protein n=1 Tax=Halocaridina rubra TaxID=373956 RepID=A0AAN8WKE5_HALRR
MLGSTSGVRGGSSTGNTVGQVCAVSAGCQQIQIPQQQQGNNYGSLEQHYLSGGTDSASGVAATIACTTSTPAQVVQVATVPFSPVIPINPVVTNLSVQLPAATTTEGLRQSLILSPDQRQLQEQLRRKHAELQQQILRQQEELRQVNDQLIMAQYGMSLQHLYKGGVQYATTSPGSNNAGYQNTVAVGSGVGGVLNVGTAGGIPVTAAIHSGAGGALALGTGTLAGTIATSSLMQPLTMTTPSTLQSSTLTVSTLSPAQVSIQGVSTQGMAVPYQLSHQQAQMLFAQPSSTPQAHHSSPHHQPKK